jgi:putative ABC transport system permease protein
VRAPAVLQGHRPSVLVTALGAAFGVAVLVVTRVLTQALEADPVTGSSTTVGVLLTLAGVVFVVIAVFVGSVVTTNTFASVVQSRVRTIALMRLLGSSAASQRRGFLREGLVVGTVGAALGGGVGLGVSAAATQVLVAAGVLPSATYRLVGPVLLLPLVGVVLATVSAGWTGSRAVLGVTPLQAVGAAQEGSPDEQRRRPRRTVLATTIAATGTAVLVAGVVVGQTQPLGVLVALAGGVVSFSGVALGAHLYVPGALRLVGLLTRRSLPARLASASSARHPDISTRTALGVLVGVTLVATFTVGLATFRALIIRASDADPAYYEGIDAMFRTTSLVAGGLIGFSVLIAVIGLVNDMSMSVRRRRGEIGLLRTLGLSVRAVRAMVTAEAAQVAFTSIVLGTLLGVLYGWAGAQSLLGSIRAGGMIAPVVPPALVVSLLVVGVVVTAVAAVAPARRATEATPIVALAEAVR